MNEQKVRFILRGAPTHGRRRADRAKSFAKGFEGRTLFEHFNLHLRAGDRVALIGANGVGKTTLLNMIAGQLPPDTGTVVFGANVDLGYYESAAIRPAPGKGRARTSCGTTFRVWRSTACARVLALFLLTGDDVFQAVSRRSPAAKRAAWRWPS